MRVLLAPKIAPCHREVFVFWCFQGSEIAPRHADSSFGGILFGVSRGEQNVFCHADWGLGEIIFGVSWASNIEPNVMPNVLKTEFKVTTPSHNAQNEPSETPPTSALSCERSFERSPLQATFQSNGNTGNQRSLSVTTFQPDAGLSTIKGFLLVHAVAF